MSDHASSPPGSSKDNTSKQQIEPAAQTTMTSSPQSSPTARRSRNPVHPKIAAAGQRILSSEHQFDDRRASTSSDRPAIQKLPSTIGVHDRTASGSSSAGASSPRAPRAPLASAPVAVPGAARAQTLSPLLHPAALDRTRDSSPGSMSLDEIGSQACQASSDGSIILDSDEGDAAHGVEEASRSADGSVEPLHESGSDLTAFVMPSITLPVSKEYTDRGRRMGCLNLIVTGPRSAGKTAFVRHVLAGCGDVVHVDQSRILPDLDESGSWAFKETRASTRPVPTWSRRSGKGSKKEGRPDRNLSVIDAPCYHDRETPQPEHESHQAILNLLKERSSMALNSERMDNSSRKSFLLGNSHPQIDALVHLFSPDAPIDHYDWSFLRRAAGLTNIIPVISHADTRPRTELDAYRDSITDALGEARIDPFDLNATVAGDARQATIYTISTATDETEMDASILMSDTYTRPLVPSELGTLTSRLFDPDTIKRLHHDAVEKLLAHPSAGTHTKPLPQPHQALRPNRSAPDAKPRTPQRDKQNWAHDLRHSMRISSASRGLHKSTSDVTQREKHALTSDPLGLMSFAPSLLAMLGFASLCGGALLLRGR